MQSLFNFKKWYFDFTTAQDEVGYLYFITLRIGPFRQNWTSLQFYQLGHERHYFQQKGMALSHLPPSSWNGQEQDLHFRFLGCQGTLHYKPLPTRHPEALKSNLVWPTFTALRWTIPMPASQVRGTLELKNAAIKITGIGYHDVVEISTFPAGLRIKRMYWGRVLASDWWLVFLSLQQDSEALLRSLVYVNESQQDLHVRHFDLQEEEGAMQISFANGLNQAHVNLFKTRNLENASAISERREPNAMLKYLYRLISGNPYERKYSGKAELLIGKKRKAGEAIFERVDWLN